MQKIILLSLCILTGSKLNTIEFDKEISFDKDNNVFEFTTKTEGALFVYISFPVSGLLSLQFHDCGLDASSRIDKPGDGNILPFKGEMTCKLELLYKDQSSNEKGKNAPFNR